jgi:hypothetical protein
LTPTLSALLLTVDGVKIQGREVWTLSERLGGGGFGQVFRAVSDDGQLAAAKLVPKAPGAQRELLFEQLSDVPNVVPIIDTAETVDAWVLVMPLAERALADEMDQRGLPPLDQALVVLIEIANALAALEGNVVHRDLKPQNVLLLEGRWCLADFGIARYAEASTAPDTRKFAMSMPYAAPERWRGERATAAADVYSLGVMAHEVLAGALPFSGPSDHEFREQHLHADPPSLQGATTRLTALIEECLFKAPQSRPTPTNLLARLAKAGDVSRLPGASSLAAANQAAVARAGEAAAGQSRQRTEQERRAELATAAHAQLKAISAELLDVLTTEAPAAAVTHMPARGWKATLEAAAIGLSQPAAQPQPDWGGWQAPAIDVISHATISIVFSPDRFGYEGRSHSLWYCDAKQEGEYGWFETAFMHTPLTRRQANGQDPFALLPSEASAKALWSGMAEYQVAWPFTRLVVGELEELVDRWLGWFAAATQGALHRPSTMAEQQPVGSWRR